MKPANSMTPKEYQKAKRKVEDLSSLFYIQMKRLEPKWCEKMVQEHPFHPTRKWRFDIAWTELKVAVECDGGQHKARGGRHNQDPDREKINTATAMGWSVFRFSGNQIKNDPQGCIEIVRSTLEQRAYKHIENEKIKEY